MNHELIMVIVNKNLNKKVMEAATNAGARGGTILRGKEIVFMKTFLLGN